MPLATRMLRGRLAWQKHTSLTWCPAVMVRQQLPRDTRIAPVRFASYDHNRKPSAIAQRLPDPEHQPQRFREFDLEGKVFVVTGGGRGLGLTLAEVLVEAGGKGTLRVVPPGSNG